MNSQSYSGDNHVGTAALGCPAEQSSADRRHGLREAAEALDLFLKQ
jgi:hypothetical protein